MSWTVLKYKVYDAGQSPAKLLDTLDESASGDNLTGLEPAKDYKLSVRVYYELDCNGFKNQTCCDFLMTVMTGSLTLKSVSA